MGDETLQKWSPASAWIRRFNDSPRELADAIKEWERWAHDEYYAAIRGEVTPEQPLYSDLTDLLILWCDTETHLDAEPLFDFVSWTQHIIGCHESEGDTVAEDPEFDRMHNAFAGIGRVMSRLKLIVQLRFDLQVDGSPTDEESLTPSEREVLDYVRNYGNPVRQSQAIRDLEDRRICSESTTRTALARLRRSGFIAHNGAGYVPPQRPSE